MQYLESSIIGVRSAVITMRRRTTPLRFVLFPMVHVAEPAFYAAVEARAGRCDLIVAEGVPSRYFPVQEWMSKIRLDRLVDQINGLDLERTGVPVQWEEAPPSPPKSGRDQAVAVAVDSATALVLRALGRYGSPLGMPSLEQADEHDDRWDRRAAGRLERAIQDRVLDSRDCVLVKALGAIHRERYGEQAKIAVVYGAAHIPAVVDYLTEAFKYYVEKAEWLTVAHAPEAPE
jgi:hypothetical protein